MWSSTSPFRVSPCRFSALKHEYGLSPVHLKGLGSVSEWKQDQVWIKVSIFAMVGRKMLLLGLTGHGTVILTIVNLVIPAVVPKMDFPLLNASWMEVSCVKYFLTAKRDKASVRSFGCYMIHAARNSWVSLWKALFPFTVSCVWLGDSTVVVLFLHRKMTAGRYFPPICLSCLSCFYSVDRLCSE